MAESLTELQREMLALLTDEPQRCAGLGEKIWYHGRGSRAGGQSTCAWARPAGKVLWQLDGLGYAAQRQPKSLFSASRLGWVITAAGRRALEA